MLSILGEPHWLWLMYPERACARGCSENMVRFTRLAIVYNMEWSVIRETEYIRSYNYIIMTDIGYYYFTRIQFIYPYNLPMYNNSLSGDIDMERRLSGVVTLFQLVSVAENKRFWS